MLLTIEKIMSSKLLFICITNKVAKKKIQKIGKAKYFFCQETGFYNFLRECKAMEAKNQINHKNTKIQLVTKNFKYQFSDPGINYL